MKKIIYLIAFLFAGAVYSQGGGLIDALKFRGSVTTTIRDTFTVPTNQNWIIYNTTTEQYETAGDDEVWTAFGSGSGTDDQTATEVVFTADGTIFSTNVQAAIEEVRNEAPLLGSGSENNFSSDNTFNRALQLRGRFLGAGEQGWNKFEIAHIADSNKLTIDWFEGIDTPDTEYYFTGGGTPELNIAGRGIRNNSGQLQFQNASSTWTNFGSGGGSDSGQGMVTQTKAAVTETFDNSDVVSGGTSGNKRMFTKFSGQNEITLDDGITEYNQPFLLLHNSASDSTLVKKGTNTVFKMAGTGVLAEDGFYFKNFETPTVIALASNEYLINASNYTTYTAADPVDSISDIVASWREDDLPAVGSAVGDWTDRINSYVMVAKGSPTVTAITGGGKEALYDGVDDAHANDAGNASLEPVPGTDTFSYVVKLGTSVDFSDTPFCLTPVGSSSYQYGLQFRGTNTRTRVGGTTYENAGTVNNNSIVVVTVSLTEIKTYIDGTLIGTDALIGTTTHNLNLSFASLASGTSDFQQIGLRDFIFFSKVLTQAEINTIQSNL